MPQPSRKDQSIELLRSSASKRFIEKARLIAEVNSIYVTTDRDEELDAEIETVIAHMLDPTAVAGYAIAVTAPPGAGKTSLINNRLDAAPELAPRDDGYGNQVEFCLRVQTPSACTVKSLGTAILKATGYPLEREPPEDQIWNIVEQRLQRKMHKIIFFDEFQHVLKGAKAKGSAHLTNKVKLMMQNPEWPLWLIIAGVPDTTEFIKRDEWFQMERRVRPFEIDDLEDFDGDIENTRDILEALANAAELSIGFPITDEFLRRLMHGGLWRFGMVIQLIKMSIELALGDADCDLTLQLGHFVKGYKRISSCSRGTNVFTATDWHLIQRHVTPKGRLSSAHTLIERVGVA